MNRIIYILCIFNLALNFINVYSKSLTQDDTVKAVYTALPPIVDGLDTEECWKNARWQNIDKVWIPYDTILPSSDFSGRYKVVWSDSTDRLYLLVEVTEDKMHTGYYEGAGGWPNYDCVEIFIDEDKSGGDHQFTNNAFAYHIVWEDKYNVFHSVDVEGNFDPVDYADLFDVALINFMGTNVYTWEIEMPVYDDGFSNAQRLTYPVTPLEAGKVMGFSIAYCDNDDGGSRDNFIGSVAVSEANSNLSYINADLFGTMRLVIEPDTAERPNSLPENRSFQHHSLDLFPVPATEIIQVLNPYPNDNKCSIRIIDISGKIMVEAMEPNQNEIFRFNVSQYPDNVYFIEISNGKSISSGSFTIVH